MLFYLKLRIDHLIEVRTFFLIGNSAIKVYGYNNLNFKFQRSILGYFLLK